jgi:hypothetical protein
VKVERKEEGSEGIENKGEKGVKRKEGGNEAMTRKLRLKRKRNGEKRNEMLTGIN